MTPVVPRPQRYSLRGYGLGEAVCLQSGFPADAWKEDIRSAACVVSRSYHTSASL
jgi:hypothetical protein